MNLFNADSKQTSWLDGWQGWIGGRHLYNLTAEISQKLHIASSSCSLLPLKVRELLSLQESRWAGGRSGWTVGYKCIAQRQQ